MKQTTRRTDKLKVNPPSEAQIARVLELYKKADEFQRGKVLGKLEAYVEKSA